MKKIFLFIILLTISCSKDKKKLIINHLHENKSYDYRVWDLKDLDITNSTPISESCSEYNFTYTLILKEKCFPKKILSNSLFNYLADDEEYYQWDRCWSQSLINNSVDSWEKGMIKKIDTKICTRKENIVLGGPCVEWRIIDQNYINTQKDKQKSLIQNRLQREFLKKGNVIQIKDDLRVCD